MTYWPVPATQVPVRELPGGLHAATMPRRFGAWIIDRLLAGLLSIVAVILGLVTGAVTLNQTALDQLGHIPYGTTRPFADVTAPLINVKTGPLVAALVLYVALLALYYVWSWAGYGRTPGQGALGLRVLDASTGVKLSFDQAFLRWALLDGIAAVIGAALLVPFLNSLATTSTNQWLDAGYGATFTAGGSGWVGIASNAESLLSGLWMIALAISSATNPVHQGLHDRIVGSIVTGPAPAPIASGWYGSPGIGYPPQAWPGYPPPQGPGYPPQPGPGYPPQGPGYPPQAWPGYPPQIPPASPPAPENPPAGAPPEPPRQ